MAGLTFGEAKLLMSVEEAEAVASAGCPDGMSSMVAVKRSGGPSPITSAISFPTEMLSSRSSAAFHSGISSSSGSRSMLKDAPGAVVFFSSLRSSLFSPSSLESVKQKAIPTGSLRLFSWVHTLIHAT